jgi:hypothetical protein
MTCAIHRCALCPRTRNLRGVVVAGKELLLCRHHLDKLGDAVPESFDDLAAFFAKLGLDRRKLPSRRRAERRTFPPRPELRRGSEGRRATDPDG